MGTLGKTLSLVSFVVGLAISLLVYAKYSQAQEGMMGAIAANMNSFGMSSWDGDNEDELPKLTTERIAAPANGSASRDFEIVHIDQSKGEEMPPVAEVAAEAEVGLPENATFGEKLSYYFAQMSVWLFGEKEESLEMSCKTKKDGGKVCSVVRG